MGVNPAEQGVENALVNEIKDLKQSVIDLKTKPQPIGNGSINYAIGGGGIFYGGISIAAGAVNTYTLTLFTTGVPLTYNSLPAINRVTLTQFYFTVSVDVNDTAHDWPYGSSLNGNQQKLFVSTWNDLAGTPLSESSGQTRIYFQLFNQDSSAHTYYVRANYLIPRPALQPQ
jgi:hypothetical protein